MKDVDLIDMIATRCEEGLAAIGFTIRQFPVLQNYQPRQQGVPTGNSVYLEKLYSHVYGTPGYSLKYEESSDLFREKESQIYNTTFQISVLLPQIPGNNDLPTAADAAEHLQRWLSSRASLRIFRAKGVSIYRVMDVRNIKFKDDQEQHEAFPSFDITFNHINSLESEVGAVHRVVGRLIGV